MTNRELVSWQVWRMSLLAALIAFPALAQERVAVLTKVAGEVSITRAGDERVEKAVQMGPRVLGGSVFGGDLVATGAGSSATLVFSDGTRIELEEQTRLAADELDRSQLVPVAEGEKPIGRRIKLLAGEIYSDIAENPEIATEFETPTGVAAVKGTTITLSVSRDGV